MAKSDKGVKQSNASKMARLYGSSTDTRTDSRSKGKGTDEVEFLADVRKKSLRGEAHLKDNWKLALNDLDMLNGDQWSAQDIAERDNDGRPMITSNVLPTYVDQVIGDQLQNKPTIRVSPMTIASVPKPTQNKPIPIGQEAQAGTMQKTETLKMEGSRGDQYELGQVMSGLIKSIEYNCDAEEAYDIAFQSAVESGFGYLRVRTDYISDESMDQDIIIEAIRNQFSVIHDPLAQKTTKSDANWCLIHDEMDKSAFDELYPDASSDFIGGDGSMDGWFSDERVRVSEYYNREPVVKRKLFLSNGIAMYKEDIVDALDELLAQGVTVVRERDVKTYRTYWRKITGSDVLEGPIELKTSTIPVYMVAGKSITKRNKTIYRSVIRNSLGPQKMLNFFDTAAAEKIALAPKSPWIASVGQIAGYEQVWQNANTGNYSVLPYNSIPAESPPKRTQGAETPIAEINMASQYASRIKETTGLFDASLGASGNETSGRAIIARQRQGDRGTFKFNDNLVKTIKQCARVILELIPTVYDTDRVVRIKFADESEDFVQINQQVYDEQSEKYITIYDLDIVKYDVAVSTGPSYATQRLEASDWLTSFAQAVPGAAAAISDLIAANSDAPGADVLAERLKKTIDPRLLTKAERELLAEDEPDQEQPPQPTPEQLIQMEELEVRKVEAQAKMASAEATGTKATLQSAESQAKLQSLAQTPTNNESMPDLIETVRDIVAEALAELSVAQ